MSFLVKTNALGVPLYVCGLLEGDSCGLMGNPIILSPIVFNATEFETREEAKEFIEQMNLGGAIEISEILGSGVSPELMQ